MRTWGLIFSSVLALTSCHRRGVDSGTGGGGGSATPTADEEAAAGDAAMGLGVATSVLALSDALFRFDPDLDPSGSASQNAGKIQKNAGTAACAQVMASSPTQFTVDFGAGCTFGPVTVSGRVDVSVSLHAGATRSVAVDLVLTQLVVDGFDVSGTASFTTSTGLKFAVAFDLDHAGAHDAGDLTVVGAHGYFTASGSLTFTRGGASTAFALAGVELARGACWPRAGTAEMTSGATDVTLAFEAATATSGLAILTFPLGKGTASTCFALPSHGSCAADACPPP